MPDPEDVIPLVEESLRVDRRKVTTAQVRVATVTEEVEEIARLSLEASEVKVTRVPVGREIDETPPVRTEGDVMIIPVVEEVLVVTKRLVLKEELHIARRRVTRMVEQPVTLRRQRADVLRIPAGRPSHHEEIDMAHTAEFSTRNLTAFFDDRAEAETAMARLKELGLDPDHIRLSGGEEFAGRAATAYREKGFWESVSDFFFPEDDRVTYAEGLRRGGYLLTLSEVPDALHDQALDILEEQGSVDLDERSAEWRAEGWEAERAEGWDAGSDVSPSAAGMAASATGIMPAAHPDGRSSVAAGAEDGVDRQSSSLMADDAAARGLAARSESDLRSAGWDETGAARRDTDLSDEVIPVVEETLRVGKRDVNLGRVRVRSYVVERPVSEDITLRQDHVEIERRPVDRTLTGDEAAFRDRVIEAEEHAEEAVISKEARVTEEIALRRSSEEHTETVKDTVRHTEVEVEDERSSDRLGSAIERSEDRTPR